MTNLESFTHVPLVTKTIQHSGQVAFVTLANAFFLYICCILQYLYFVNSINDIFSITHFVFWSLPPRLWLMQFAVDRDKALAFFILHLVMFDCTTLGV